MPFDSKLDRCPLRCHAQHTANPDYGCLHQEKFNAIANLATTTASDRAAIVQLTAIVTRLTTDLAMVKKKLFVSLQAKRASRGSRGGRNKTTRRWRSGSGTGARACSTERTRAGAPTLAEASVDLKPLIHYCWTCGPGCRHNSANCPKPAAGHIYMATKRDM